MFSIVQNLEQGSTEWLEYRCGKIMATDAPIIMGENPYENLYDRWLRKVTGTNSELNDAMRKGIELEPFARSAYEQVVGKQILPVVVESTKWPWMAASLDGISRELNEIIEIKCPGPKTHQMAKEGTYPKYYYGQMQHQLAVTGLDQVTYLSYFNQELIKVIVPRDDEYIDKLVAASEIFYHQIKNFEAPELEEAYEQIETEQACSVAADYLRIKNQMKELDKQLALKRDELIAIADNRNIQIHDIKIKKIARKGSISYKDIPELASIDLEKYRSKPTEFYSILHM